MLDDVPEIYTTTPGTGNGVTRWVTFGYTFKGR